MSYGKFSEVYYAESWDKDCPMMIKIGETDNARRRARQLEREGYFITQSIDVTDGKAARLFVESYVRMCILNTNRVNQIGNDYFQCHDLDVKMYIESSFNAWVYEAEHILSSIGKAKVSNRPIPPAKYSSWFNRIWDELAVSPKYDFYFQCKYKEQDDFFDALQKHFCPFGYNCFTDRKTSWAYFTVVKM